jgi:pimeloyl-ACP methyl ester carboxylesterase
MKDRLLCRVVLACGIALVFVAEPTMVAAQATPGICHAGVLPSGALSEICVPQAGWNGDLIVFAHGYVAPNEPIGFHHLELPDGTRIPDLVQSLGFAFATTSYRQNGLAVLEGAEDIAQLVGAFGDSGGQSARRTYLAGVSQGGIVVALALERAPQLFTGALSACGPIGTFRGQINYIGDFRTLFDFYYPNVLPGAATDVPPWVLEHWHDIFVPVITALVNAHPARALELIRVARAPVDPANPSTIAKTVIDVLWYNVFGTNDARAKLGGNPFDNVDRWYSGSGDDFLLNALVRRYAADPPALQTLAPYELSGGLVKPMVTLHTTADQVIPFGHEILYALKAQARGASSRFIPIPIGRYGHCEFTTGEVLTGLFVLLSQP